MMKELRRMYEQLGTLLVLLDILPYGMFLLQK